MIKLNKKFVFTISRGFFWIFVIVSSLTILTATFVFIYSIIPPTKREITKKTYPEKPAISYEEVLSEITPIEKTITKSENTQQQVEYTEEESDQEVSYVEPTKDTLQLKFETLMDSLGSLIKTDWNLTYERYIVGYDWFGRPIYTSQQKKE